MTGRPRLNVPSPMTTMLGLTLTRLGLRTLGYRRTREIAERLIARRSLDDTINAADEHQFAAAVADRVTLAAVYFPGRAICLEQSLVLYTLLRRRGLVAELKLGVQPYPFAAHAWVELHGTPVNEIEARTRFFHTLHSGA